MTFLFIFFIKKKKKKKKGKKKKRNYIFHRFEEFEKHKQIELYLLKLHLCLNVE